jgi:hypothetical protein
MSNVPAEVSAYFSKIAKDASQNLSPEARHLRARTAAEARWAFSFTHQCLKRTNNRSLVHAVGYADRRIGIKRISTR